MDFNHILMSISKLPLFDKWAWGSVGVAILAAVGLILFWERRYFGLRDKAGSWLSLRLLSLFLLLPVTAGVIIIPSMAISGPEALAYFYIALLIIGPLIWLGSHMLCGQLLLPAFSKGESLFMAASGLLIMLLPFGAATVAQGPIFHASRGLTESAFQGAPAATLPYTVEPLQRFNLPGIGLVYTQSLIAPPYFELERIDRKLGDGWYDTKTSSRYVFCRDRENLHLMWSASEEIPVLRLYWRLNGKRVQADFTPSTASADQGGAREFSVNFRSDGIDPPVPIPRQRASIAYFVGPENLYFNSLNPLQAGESFDNDCIMQGYKRVDWEKEGPPQAVALMFYRGGNAPPIRAEIKRQAEHK